MRGDFNDIANGRDRKNPVLGDVSQVLAEEIRKNPSFEAWLPIPAPAEVTVTTKTGESKTKIFLQFFNPKTGTAISARL